MGFWCSRNYLRNFFLTDVEWIRIVKLFVYNFVFHLHWFSLLKPPRAYQLIPLLWSCHHKYLLYLGVVSFCDESEWFIYLLIIYPIICYSFADHVVDWNYFRNNTKSNQLLPECYILRPNTAATICLFDLLIYLLSILKSFIQSNSSLYRHFFVCFCFVFCFFQRY